MNNTINEIKMLKLKTHRVRPSKLQPLPAGTAVPGKVRRAALCLRADLGASLVPVGDLGHTLYAPVSGTSSTVEGPPRTTIYLPGRDVHNGLMKTKGPHHDPVEKEFDFI